MFTLEEEKLLALRELENQFYKNVSLIDIPKGMKVVPVDRQYFLEGQTHFYDLDINSIERRVIGECLNIDLERINLNHLFSDEWAEAELFNGFIDQDESTGYSPDVQILHYTFLNNNLYHIFKGVKRDDDANSTDEYKLWKKDLNNLVEDAERKISEAITKVFEDKEQKYNEFRIEYEKKCNGVKAARTFDKVKVILG